jgi:hypothetical protein
MEPLSAADLLALWEQGSGASPHQRALLLLGAARPDLPRAGLGAVPLGARDAELLRLRRSTFGERLAATIACPACGEQLDLEISADAIQPAVDADSVHPPIGVAVAGRELAIRPPTTDDLIAAAEAVAHDGAEHGTVRRALVARLVIGDSPAGNMPPDDAISSELDVAIGEALAAADPDLQLALDVSCPACAHAWVTPLDVTDFLWTEVVAGARRVADEVAGLAAAYGWRESEILALSPWRRRMYLDLATV